MRAASRLARSRTVGVYSWPDAKAKPVKHIDRLRGAHQQTGRRRRARGALRGGRKPAAARQEMVGLAGMEPADRQAV